MKKKSKKILLIDDDADMLDIGKIIIQRAGFKYFCASSGEEGLVKIVSEEPDLIILDYMMPKMSGLELFQEIKQNPDYEKYRDIPVIMLTARSDEQIDQTSLFEGGLAAFLIKPFGHRELINVIENVLKMAEVRQKNVELEEEIERTKYKYRDLIENANDLIFMLDTEGKVNFINRQLLTIAKLKPDQWIDHFLVDMIIPQDKSILDEAITNCLSGSSQQLQLRIRDRDNTIRYFSTHLNPLFDNKKVTGMVGIARDITEKYQLESRIANLESFTESIIKSMGSGLITVDQNRKITFFNSAAEEILGYKSTDVLNKLIDDIFPNGESKSLLPANGKHRPIFSQEMEVTHSTGKKVHIGFSHTPWFDGANVFLGSIITFRDISETKKMQIEMVRMDRLASLGVLAAGIAHEIRNPLAGIKTMAQTLEEEVGDDDPHQEYLHRIVRQVNRLDELLRAFFSYARPRPPVKKFHQLQDIIHEVAVLLGKRFSHHNIQFSETYDKDLKPVYVDLNQIQQVFLNLIINAIDAMPNGGTLKLAAKNVKTRALKMDRRGRAYRLPQKKKSFVEISLKDSGIGIRKEHLNTIFDPFFTTKPQGTGLGLSIVYRIVDENGGEISVTSELEQGTEFKLLLPTEE